jgi:Flp pilus assembly protein TadG
MFHHSSKTNEKGQSMVLIALMVIAFVAILALVLDGGSAYAARRTAQNAADAGALAGAQYMCKHQDATGGANTATDYAINHNGATGAVANANLSSGTVVVTATVQQDTFFASLIGAAQVAPKATATAKCDNPSVGIGTLPVAWSCRPPVGGLPGESCTQKLGPCDPTAKGGNGDGNLGNDLACLYIVMDSKKTTDDVQCDVDPYNGISPGTIDCDINNDGLNDLMAGGDRSWLDFGPNLKDYIGYPPDKTQTVKIHEWWPGKAGNVTSSYANAKELVGHDVVIPVFNKLCGKEPTSAGPANPESTDMCTANIPPDVIKSGGGGAMYYHVASFAIFHVTCVTEKKSDYCYGHDELLKAKLIKDNENTIEGYFVKDNMPGYGGGGGPIDAYAFVVNLIK